MEYIKMTVYTGKAGTEILADKLMDIGICGVEISNPDDIADLMNKKNEYDWDYLGEEVLAKAENEPSVTFYLDNDDKGMVLQKKVTELVKRLKSEDAHSEMGRMVLESSVVDDSQWKDKWKEYFKPAHITDRIVVKPTWEEYVGSENEMVIEIDPGAAFGTGTHPTTKGCITLMEKYIKPGMKVLDVGCGSGILSIAAGLLGASEVLGIEIDRQAVEVGKENVELNRLSDRIKVEYGDLTKGVDFEADAVVANLMADLVKVLSKDVSKHIKPEGVYISSGILLELEEEVSEHIKSCGFDIIDIYENENDGGWCAIAARRKGAHGSMTTSE